LRAIFTAAGVLVRRIDYDAWGNIDDEIITVGYENVLVPFGFAGGLYDRDTGLVLFGYRDYDPQTGRWTNLDPIGFAGGSIDLYAYCSNDPVNLCDPLGLLAWYDEVINISANIAAGFGDTITGGLTSMARDFMGTNDFVDQNSSSYKIGVAGGVAWDVAMTYASVGGASMIRREVAIVSKAKQRSEMAHALGKAGEKASGVLKNTERIESVLGTAKYRVPDGLDHANRIISEVKNTCNLSYTKQLQDYSAYAGKYGYNFNLHIRKDTILSKPLREAIADGIINPIYYTKP
jgi:RHS repeat-associated protein